MQNNIHTYIRTIHIVYPFRGYAYIRMIIRLGGIIICMIRDDIFSEKLKANVIEGERGKRLTWKVRFLRNKALAWVAKEVGRIADCWSSVNNVEPGLRAGSGTISILRLDQRERERGIIEIMRSRRKWIGKEKEIVVLRLPCTQRGRRLRLLFCFLPQYVLICTYYCVL